MQNRHRPAFIVFGIILGLLISALSTLTICVLLKCRKLTRQIRLMAIHLTATNLAFGVLFVMARSYELTTGSSCGLLDRTTALPFVLFNIFLTAAGFDRLLSLLYTIKYTLWTKRQNAYVLIGLLYVIGIVLHIPHLPKNLIFSCKRDNHNLFTYKGLWSFVLSTMLLTACDVVLYFYIGVLAIKVRLPYHSIGKNDYKNFSLATLKTFLLSIITIAMLGPFEIRAAINLWNFDDYRFYESRTAAILAVFHQIVSPILILISYKECRYRLAAFCLCFCEDKRGAIERDYKQYYATFVITHARNEVCSIR